MPPLPPRHWVDQDAAAHAPPVRFGWPWTVRAVAEAMFARADGRPPDEARLRWLCAQTEDFLVRVGLRSILLFRFSLFVVTWVAPLFALRIGPLGWWGVATRGRALERYERSPLGPTLLVLKAILSILYYEHPDAAADIGFDGAPLLEGDA